MRALATILLLLAIIYLFLLILLWLGGKRIPARAIIGFIPDCIILFKDLLGDRRVARKYKWMLGLLIGYLALPIDIIPDFIPGAGQLDDAILVALVLKLIVKNAGQELIREKWRGPKSSLDLILKLTPRV